MNPRTLLIPLVVALAACGDDPVSYSEPVGINLKVKSSEVDNGVLTDDKNINTEQGNPYAAFMSKARTALGGKAPGRIEIDRATLLLGANSTGVTKLGEVFTGEVALLFEMNESNFTVPVANQSIANSAGAGPVSFQLVFDSGLLATVDYDRLIAGGFKVAIRGPAATGFDGKDADLQVTFTFTAFE